jgi:plasmid stabilization system protein ParE
MKAVCRLARAARRDLQEIADYWTAEAGEKQAAQVIGDVVETLVTLAGHPGAGVAADQFGIRVRKFPAGKYMAYYRPYSQGIEILHVFHGARNQKKAWKASAATTKRN